MTFRMEYLDRLHIMDQMVVYCEWNIMIGIHGNFHMASVLIIHVITSSMSFVSFILPLLSTCHVFEISHVRNDSV